MSKRKLLLADDSVTIQKVVNLTFADEGIEVIAVGDGNAAMEKFVESTPDLVMVDVNMPGFDGYKICEIIKQDEETRHIPVILLVGSFEPFDEEEALRVGADDFLTKPFQSIRQLVSKVTGLLDGSITGVGGESSSAENQTAELSPLNVSGTAATAAAAADWTADGKPNFVEGDSGISAADDDDAKTNGETAPLAQIGSLPADETQKLSLSSSETDSARTQLLSDDELPEINLTFDNESTSTEKVYEFADDENYRTETDNDFAGNALPGEAGFEEDVLETVQPAAGLSDNATPEQTERGEKLSLIDIDEINLLEISFDDDDEFYGFEDETIEEVKLIEEEAKEPANVETRGEETPEENDFSVPTYATAEEIRETEETEETEIPEAADRQHFVNQTEAPTQAAPADEFNRSQPTIAGYSENQYPANMSPELIDRIAAKVIEKLSDKVIREIAWEVVPQMADLIVQKMADDKLNR